MEHIALENYDALFELIQNTLIRQEEQKKKGLNNYNMVNIVRKATHEVGMHSNIIYSLINPNSNHFQDDLFLNKFIETIILSKLELTSLQDFGQVYSVKAEEPTETSRRIDFTIKSNKYLIGIEMKVNAPDLHCQISDYYNHLKEESKNDNDQHVYIFYLTKYGSNPSDKSLKKNQNNKTCLLDFHKDDHVKNISFEKDVLNWIETCQKEVRNITNLNIALENYKEIVQKITNQYKGNVVSIKEELLNDTKSLRLALKLDKEMHTIKGQLLYNFFEKVKKKISDYNQNYKPVIILPEKNQLTPKKCTDSFTQKRGNTHFGLVFDCNFGNNKYFFIKVAQTGLYYGVVDTNKIKEIVDSKQKLEKFSYCHDKIRETLKLTSKHEKCAKYFGDINKLEQLIDSENILEEMVVDIQKIEEILKLEKV
ncbi:MAG: Unknown protein [uncultured Sulfurovum sp.]|uniref:PD-(D/E)XK nuclease superfamily protein n=1 Tax=uncultured Sulfurovum sp. TaxID=269237 RepID=A0A6S6SX12_9BACT|nr:MAG: Unknown protein [uncultured Sulfurovum sp.]